MSRELIEKLFHKDGEFYSGSKGGDLFATLDQDIAMIVSFVYRTLHIFMELCTAITMAAVLFWLRWELLLMMLAFIPTSFYINYVCNKRVSKLAKNCRDEYGEQGALIEEFISNSVPMIMFGIRKAFMNKFVISQRKYNRSYKKLSFFNQIASRCTDVSMNFASMISMIYGGFMVFKGKMTIGILVVFMEYVDSFISPLLSLAALKTMAFRLNPSLIRIENIWNGDNYVRKPMAKIETYNIRFKNVSFSYPNGKMILNNVNFEFQLGTTYAIVGKSGEGKSTIVSLLLNLWKPQTGEILIGEYNINEIEKDQVRECISIVSQDTFFLHDTILENLSVDRKCSEGSAISVLKKVGLYNEVMGMPDGVYSVIGDRGITLSGGQRQRLAIARALIKDAPIIIFDEPTSALDPNTEQVVYDAIKTLCNKVIIIISHHKNVEQIADHVLKVEGKKVVLER